MTCRLAIARQVPGTIYNACSESWVCGALAECVRSLRAEVVVICGQATVDGIPQALDADAFRRTFDFAAQPLQERLHACHGRG